MAETTDPDKIRDLAELFECRGINTLDDLRRCISHDLETGVRWVSSTTGASQALLLALLIAEASDEGAGNARRNLATYWKSLSNRSRYTSLPRRAWHGWKAHVPDMLAVGLALLITAGVVLVVVRAQRLQRTAVPYVAVKQGVNLQAFHQLRDDDLEMNRKPGVRGSFISFDQVRGRYTLTTVSANTVLRSNHVLSADLSSKLRDRRILTVALKPTAHSPGIVPPCEALLILSPRTAEAKTPQPPILGVIVLSIDSVGDTKSFTVAVTETDFALISPLLATHDAFLSDVIR